MERDTDVEAAEAEPLLPAAAAQYSSTADPASSTSPTNFERRASFKDKLTGAADKLLDAVNNDDVLRVGKDVVDRTQSVVKGVVGVQNHEVEDSMTYYTADLSCWSSLFAVSMTIYHRRSLWITALRLFGFSTIVALTVVVLTQDPVNLKVHRFTEISKFLHLFVGLLLGFFMSASVNRWWSCAEGFLSLFDAVRNLQMQLVGLGVKRDLVDECLRFGVLSGWILNMQLHTEALPAAKRDEDREAMWERLENGDGMDDVFGVCLPNELEVIRHVEDPSSLMWVWIASLIGRMSEDGDIPPMQSPTYGRVMNLVHDAHTSIRKVRASISVQAPYVYVQMLASLVHVNNIINSLSFGMTWGSTMGVTWQHFADPQHVGAKEAARDFQTVIISFFFSCFGPFVYQALLEVSIAIAQPFGSVEGSIPTWRMVSKLEQDLHDGKLMAQSVAWKKPSFKK